LACGGEVTKLRVEVEDRMEKEYVRMGTDSRTTVDASLGGSKGKVGKGGFLGWKDKWSAVFAVKSAYKILNDDVHGIERELYGDFWGLKAQPSSQLTA